MTSLTTHLEETIREMKGERILRFVVPDYVHVLSNGKVVMSGGKDLALELEARGYEWVDAQAEALAQ